jgi:hypothetical protein
MASKVRTDKKASLLSPVKSPLSIDEIWLLYRYLRIASELSTSAMTWLVVKTYNEAKLLSPVKSPLSIDVILLEFRNLTND